MQMTKAMASPETSTPGSPKAEQNIAAQPAVAGVSETPDTAAEEGKKGTTGDFDVALSTLMATLNNKVGEKKITDTETEPAVETEEPKADESEAVAILESLIAASQHSVTAMPLNGSQQNTGQNANAALLKGVDAASLSAQAVIPQAVKPLATKPQVQLSANTAPVSTDAKAVTDSSVALVLTQPIANDAQEAAMLQPNANAATDGAITASSQDGNLSAQALGDKNVRFTLPDVKLSGESARWSEQLESALGDRLQMQVKDKIQHATIRLDPPNMGKIDISMHIDNGRMQVNINANHSDVYRALQHVSQELRQGLVEQNFVQVNVQVSSQSPGQQQGQQQNANAEQNDMIQLNAGMSEDESHTSHQDDESILLKV